MMPSRVIMAREMRRRWRKVVELSLGSVEKNA
jgi:hypothetical protein